MPGYMSINTQESWTIKNKRKTAGTCHGTQQWQNKGGKKGNHMVRNQAIIPQEHSEITEEPNRAIDMIEKVGQETPSQVHPTGLPASTAAPRVSSLPGSPTELLKSNHVMSLIQPPSLPLTEHTSPSPSSEASACDASSLGMHSVHCFKSAQLLPSEACPYHPH